MTWTESVISDKPPSNNYPSPYIKAKAWALLAIFVALLMLPNLLWRCLGANVDNWNTSLCIPTLLLSLFFSVLGNRLWIACLLLVPFLILAPIESLYVAEFGQPTSDAILATIFVTNPGEAREFLGPAILPILLMVFFASLLAVTTVFSVRKCGLLLPAPRLWMLAFALASAWMINGEAIIEKNNDVMTGARVPMTMRQALEGTIAAGYPFGLAVRLAQFIDQWNEIGRASTRLATFRFQVHRNDTAGRRQIFVLVIGESSRRENWQLFGYSRPTNPKLSHMGNVILVSDMITSWPLSIQAIPQLLTRRPIDDSTSFWPEPSILAVAREAGYDTHWLSNQRPIGVSDSAVSVYAHEAAHLRFMKLVPQTSQGGYDEDLLKPFQNVIANSSQDEFIVLHMMGSHLTYDFRYPPEFKIFRPTSADGGSKATWQEDMRNSYDNSILYSDFILSEIIKILQGSGAISALWYESDHGERLPKLGCDMPGHGRGSRYEYPVPAFFWYSDDYAKIYPQRIEHLRENANKRTLSADTFESLVDMLDATFPGHDESRSLFSSDWRFRPRLVNALKPVDFDNSSIVGACELIRPLNKPPS